MGTNISKLNVNGTSIGNVNVNGEDLKLVRLEVDNTDSITLFAKAFALTADTSKVSTLYCNRTGSQYAGAATGNIDLGSDLYYGDIVRFTITEKEHYSDYKFSINGSSYTLDTNYTIYNDITFTISATMQLYAPVLKSTTASSINITNTSTNPDVTVYYGTTTDIEDAHLLQVLSSGNSTTVSGLTSGQKYYIFFTSKDCTNSMADCTVLQKLAGPSITEADRFARKLRFTNDNKVTVNVSASDGTLESHTLASGESEYLTELDPGHYYTITFSAAGYTDASIYINTKNEFAYAPVVDHYTYNSDKSYSIYITNNNDVAANLAGNNPYIADHLTINANSTKQFEGSSLAALTSTQFYFYYSGYEDSVLSDELILPADIIDPTITADYKYITITNNDTRSVSVYIGVSTSSYIYWKELSPGETANYEYPISDWEFCIELVAAYTPSGKTYEYTIFTPLILPVCSNISKNGVYLTNNNTSDLLYYITDVNTSTVKASGSIDASKQNLAVTGLDALTYYRAYFKTKTSPARISDYVYFTTLGELATPTITPGDSTTDVTTSFTITNYSNVEVLVTYALSYPGDFVEYGSLAAGATSDSITGAPWWDGDSTHVVSVKFAAAGYESSSLVRQQLNERKLYAPTWSKISGNYTDVTVNNSNAQEVLCYYSDSSYIHINGNSSGIITGLSNLKTYTIYFTKAEDTHYGVQSDSVTGVKPTSYPTLNSPVISNVGYYGFKLKNTNSIAVSYSITTAGLTGTLNAGSSVDISDLDSGVTYTVYFNASQHTGSSTSVTTKSQPAEVQDIILSSVAEYDGQTYITLSNPNPYAVTVKFITNDTAPVSQYYSVNIDTLSNMSMCTADLLMFVDEAECVYYEIYHEDEQPVSGSINISTITDVQFIGGLCTYATDSTTSLSQIWFSAKGIGDGGSYYAEIMDAASETPVFTERQRWSSSSGSPGFDYNDQYFTFFNDDLDKVYIPYSSFIDNLKINFYSSQSDTNVVATLYTKLYRSDTLPNTILQSSSSDLLINELDAELGANYITIKNNNDMPVTYNFYNSDQEGSEEILSTGTLLGHEMTTIYDSGGNTVVIGNDVLGSGKVMSYSFTAYIPPSPSTASTTTERKYFTVEADGTFIDAS